MTSKQQRQNNGLLVVLSSPSGGGKTTIIRKIIQSGPPDYVYSISMTSRPKRNGETDGHDYFFVDEQTFEQHIKNNDLLEYERVHGWHYGTPKLPVEKWIKEGKAVFMDIDVFGAKHIKQEFKEKALLIFLKPPDENVLIERLKKRSTEDDEQIKKRLQRLPEEMACADDFDVVIINDDLNETVNKVKQLVEQKRRV